MLKRCWRIRFPLAFVNLLSPAQERPTGSPGDCWFREESRRETMGGWVWQDSWREQVVVHSWADPGDPSPGFAGEAAEGGCLPWLRGVFGLPPCPTGHLTVLSFVSPVRKCLMAAYHKAKCEGWAAARRPCPRSCTWGRTPPVPTPAVGPSGREARDLAYRLFSTDPRRDMSGGNGQQWLLEAWRPSTAAATFWWQQMPPRKECWQGPVLPKSLRGIVPLASHPKRWPMCLCCFPQGRQSNRRSRRSRHGIAVLPLKNKLPRSAFDGFIFITASALPQRLRTAAGDHYPGIMLNPTDIIRLAVEMQGISASPCWPGGWPLARGERLQKYKALFYYKVCPSSSLQFWYEKLPQLFQNTGSWNSVWVRGFFFLRLDKQLVSAIPTFKNSLKKNPAGFDLFVQQKDCSLIPSELLDLILLPAELMKNPLAGCVREPGDVHPLTAPLLLKTVGILKVVEQGTQLLHPFVKHGSCTPCQKAAQGWKFHCIWHKIGPNYQTGGIGDFGEKTPKPKQTPKQHYPIITLVYFFFSSVRSVQWNSLF